MRIFRIGRDTRELLLLAVAMALLLLAQRGWTQDVSEPLMLVAAPQMAGFYHQSVLIAVPIPEGRHIGFIINRPTTQSMAALFPKHEPSKKVVSPVFLGGPEMMTSIFAVLRGHSGSGAKDFPFVSGTFVVADQKSIDRIIEQSPNEARYYAGFVAWQPGELQAELDRGFWYTLPPQPDLIFRQNAERLWMELVGNASRTMTRAPSPYTLARENSD